MPDLSCLKAREYKLLLKPERFAWPPDGDQANAFLDDLRSNLNASLPKVQIRKWFAPLEPRRVSFWDTKSHHLYAAGYSLRRRSSLSKEGATFDSDELTLKLRTPDLFIALGTTLAAQDDAARLKLEEDIAPLEVAAVGPAGETFVAIAEQRSIRSRWALSASRALLPDEAPHGLNDLHALFESTARYLPVIDELGSPMIQGRAIEEHVFKGPTIDFADDYQGSLCLTLWNRVDDPSKVFVAEVSFRCDLMKGEMPAKVARRALDLFVMMQNAQQRWINTVQSSKTLLALP
ncbi:hypothetical protein OSH11_15090 [Kaistia dalseonensis]|nr:hypothetical protein [Kaistia dalseonensis]